MKMTALTTIALTLFFVSTTISTMTFAQPGGGIARLDQDGDGLVSRDEFGTPVQRRGPRMFERSDLDGDGSVTFEEMQASVAERANEKASFAEERFLEMDQNGDQVLTLDEVLNHGFNRADSNGDGYISEDEARANFERMRDQRRERRFEG
ncbi:MAG: EF-hand domain-containing protein [Pseudomonadota bacterium]